MYAMTVCVSVCESEDLLVCWHHTFSVFFSTVFDLLAVCCGRIVNDTALQAFKLSTLWKPRYNNSHTASSCGPLLCVCWHCLYDHTLDNRQYYYCL